MLRPIRAGAGLVLLPQGYRASRAQPWALQVIRLQRFSAGACSQINMALISRPITN